MKCIFFILLQTIFLALLTEKDFYHIPINIYLQILCLRWLVFQLFQLKVLPLSQTRFLNPQLIFHIMFKHIAIVFNSILTRFSIILLVRQFLSYPSFLLKLLISFEWNQVSLFLRLQERKKLLQSPSQVNLTFIKVKSS